MARTSFVLPAALFTSLFAAIGCGGDSNAPTGGGSNSTSTSTSTHGAGAGSASDGGHSGSGGAGGSSAAGGNRPDAGPPEPNPCVAAGTCPLGKWTNITPPDIDPTQVAPATNAFGPGSIAADPAHPGDFYVGGAGDVWKTTDFGTSWKKLGNVASVPRGEVIAVAGTTPATIWISSESTLGAAHISTDGGATFKVGTGILDGQGNKLGYPDIDALYSIQVDPYDPKHLISGLHELDGIVESTDGGDVWRKTSGALPSGGISWYPTFIDTGSAATTGKTWFAIAQDGASAVMTHDAGASYKIPSALNGLQHPHGSSQMFQSGSNLFVGGVYGPGQGLYRSTDLGGTWALADDGSAPQAVVWGTKLNVYTMYAWACSDCMIGQNFEIAKLPGDTWTKSMVPADLPMGPNTVAVAFDGTHSVMIGVMWAAGIWRYVEP